MPRLCLPLAVLALIACAQPPGHITRAEFGDKWPLTVDQGVLKCTETPTGLAVNRKAVTFTAPDGRTYAVNGAANGRGIPAIDPIWKTSAPSSRPIKKVERFSDKQRQTIFAESVRCEDEATKKADAKHPGDVKKQLALQDKLQEDCKAELRKRDKITKAEHDTISAEGAELSWPPLTPLRINISPLIDRGLKLCER